MISVRHQGVTDCQNIKEKLEKRTTTNKKVIANQQGTIFVGKSNIDCIQIAAEADVASIFPECQSLSYNQFEDEYQKIDKGPGGGPITKNIQCI